MPKFHVERHVPREGWRYQCTVTAQSSTNAVRHFARNNPGNHILRAREA